ncbi:MAG: iron-containing alcohol dehydrogenase [Candidatus Aenigmarchaeota archaeon]|nr:iron-containing alcohol dehydrogenase [Candidatus Aenigmarchaeota archaeon]
MELGDILAARRIELKYIEGPCYKSENLPPKLVITNDDEFTKNLLRSAGFDRFHLVSSASVEVADAISHSAGEGEILGVGGGKAIDVAKRVAHILGRPLIAFPTAPSHDGLLSRNCSLVNGSGRKSIPAKYPRKLVIPLHLWKNSGRLRMAGICDILSNIVALEDVSLAADRGVSFDPFYRDLSLSSIERVAGMKCDRDLAEALVMSGIAMENGSEYCSGSDHEVERLLEGHFGGKYLHGQLAGTGTLISAKVYSMNAGRLPRTLTFDPNGLYGKVLERMREKGVLDFAIMPLKDPSFKPNLLKGLSGVRPERYTLWNSISSEKVGWEKVVWEIESDGQ